MGGGDYPLVESKTLTQKDSWIRRGGGGVLDFSTDLTAVVRVRQRQPVMALSSFLILRPDSRVDATV